MKIRHLRLLNKTGMHFAYIFDIEKYKNASEQK